MTMTPLEPALPICSYPASNYWRVYELELNTPCRCYKCGEEGFKANSYSAHYHTKVTVPNAIPRVISADLRDWMWKEGVFKKGVHSIYAACEMDIAFLQKAMSGYPQMSHSNRWSFQTGVGANTNMDLNCQLQFAHDILFGNVTAIEGRDEVGLFLKSNDPHLGRHSGSWGIYVRKQDVPLLFLHKSHGIWSHMVNHAVNHGGINRPEVLKAVLDPSGNGFPQSDELNMHRDVVKPLDQELDFVSPGLSKSLPLIMRAAMMRGNSHLFDEIFDLIIESDFIYPTPISVMEGLQTLKTIYDRCRANTAGVSLDSMALAALEDSDFVDECSQLKLELKLALRRGDTFAGKETLKVASKSWGNIKWREKRRWLEIPVLPDYSWVRTEPACP
jgi:hypothetical protein